MRLPVTGTAGVCPCTSTSSKGERLRALSPQTAFEELVCSANHAKNHASQLDHQAKYGLVSLNQNHPIDTHYHGNEISGIVLGDPIRLSWPHVMWLSYDLSSRCTVRRLLIIAYTAAKPWNLQWWSTSILRLFSMSWCTSHLLIAPEEWRWINWVFKEPRKGELTSHSKCTK